MKTSIALLSIALLSSCASSDGFVDDQSQDCAHPIEVRVGFENMPGIRGQERMDDRLTLIVEVANNGDEDFTVRTVRTQQMTDDRAYYRLDNSSGTFNQEIPQGKDHTFRLQMAGRLVRTGFNRVPGSQADELALAVTVQLVDGRTFRCVFGVQPPI